MTATTFKDFRGLAKPLDAYDIPMLAHRINVHEDALNAFMEVEAAGNPFDNKGRPAMLFEPHLFHRYTSGEKRRIAVEQGLAYPNWRPGNYPKDSYPRLMRAVEIDARAALMACSWGGSQVLGSNYQMAGYPTPEAMVTAFMDDAQEHIEAMVRFILASGIDDDIREGRWESVARVYNGPQYAKHGYHTKLAAAARRFGAKVDSDWKPDAPDPKVVDVPASTVREVQARLHALGYHEVGTPDGKWGTRTRAGVLAFRADNNLPIVATIDDTLLAALLTAKHRSVDEARSTMTGTDLRKSGSGTIKEVDTAVAVGGVTTVVTGLAAVAEQADGLTAQIGTVQKLIDTAMPLIETVTENAVVIAVGLGVYMIWKAWKVRSLRVEDHRAGRHVGL
jgi:peptidoglycan hydrolase-like protein with peptidoglycan-binding domain